MNIEETNIEQNQENLAETGNVELSETPSEEVKQQEELTFTAEPEVQTEETPVAEATPEPVAEVTEAPAEEVVAWLVADAEALGLTAHRLKALNLIDKIVNEPLGGAHRDPSAAAQNLRKALAERKAAPAFPVPVEYFPGVQRVWPPASSIT